MEEGVDKGVFPGATYTIIYKGKEIFEVVGNKSLYPLKEENNLKTIYDLASLTKVIVTNFLIGKLKEEGFLKLEDPVQKYLVDFIHKDVTIADLLTHSSGLPLSVKWWHIKTKKEYMDLVLRTELVSKPGLVAVYSDLNFIILGELIETVTGSSLDKMAQSYLFSKLEMTETSYGPLNIERCAPTEKEGDLYLRGVVHDKKARLFGGVAGHAGVFSTIFDMAKYAHLILNEGFYKDKQIISKEIINSWYLPLVSDANGRYRTLGWIEGATALLCPRISKKAIYHQGFTGNRILVDKTHELSIIVLSNQIHPVRNNKIFGDFWAELVTLVYEKLDL